MVRSYIPDIEVGSGTPGIGSAPVFFDVDTYSLYLRGTGDAGFRLVNAVGSPGAAWFVDADGSDFNDGKSWGAPFAGVQKAVDSATAGDVIYLGPNEYDENVSITKGRLVLVGVGGKGAVRITGLASNGTAITITGANEVVLVNLNCGGRGTGAGLKLVGQTRRLRFVGCRFAGGTDGVLVNGGAGGQVVDTRFDDCRFDGGTNGVHVNETGGGDPCSQLFIKNCLFYYNTARYLYAETRVTGLHVEDCLFGPEEDGTVPSNEYVKADVTDTTGVIAHNLFASTTNATARFAIASGVFWLANGTEAGWSTARPS